MGYAITQPVDLSSVAKSSELTPLAKEATLTPKAAESSLTPKATETTAARALRVLGRAFDLTSREISLASPHAWQAIDIAVFRVTFDAPSSLTVVLAIYGYIACKDLGILEGGSTILRVSESHYPRLHNSSTTGGNPARREISLSVAAGNHTWDLAWVDAGVASLLRAGLVGGIQYPPPGFEILG